MSNANLLVAPRHGRQIVPTPRRPVIRKKKKKMLLSRRGSKVDDDEDHRLQKFDMLRMLWEII